MKTITIMQPYASLIVYGVKDIEYRSWSTDHRGPLLIHSSLRPAKVDYREEVPLIDDLWRRAVPRRPVGATEGPPPDVSKCRYLVNHPETQRFMIRPEYVHDSAIAAQYALLRDILDRSDAIFPDACVVGRVDVVDVVEDEGEGFAWHLANPVRFDHPIPDVKGRLRIWDFPIHTIMDL